MIYNLYQYLKIAFPTFDFVVDGWEDDSLDESNLMRQTGGTTPPWFPRQDYTVQFITRAKEKLYAHSEINEIYHELRNRYGCTLPAITVKIKGEDMVFPAIIAAQMSPLQIPGYIGTDNNRRHLYSYNLKVIVGG